MTGPFNADNKVNRAIGATLLTQMTPEEAEAYNRERALDMAWEKALRDYRGLDGRPRKGPLVELLRDALTPIPARFRKPLAIALAGHKTDRWKWVPKEKERKFPDGKRVDTQRRIEAKWDILRDGGFRSAAQVRERIILELQDEDPDRFGSLDENTVKDALRGRRLNEPRHPGARLLLAPERKGRKPGPRNDR